MLGAMTDLRTKAIAWHVAIVPTTSLDLHSRRLGKSSRSVTRDSVLVLPPATRTSCSADQRDAQRRDDRHTCSRSRISTTIPCASPAPGATAHRGHPVGLRRADREQPAAHQDSGGDGPRPLPRVVRPLPLPRPRKPPPRRLAARRDSAGVGGEEARATLRTVEPRVRSMPASDAEGTVTTMDISHPSAPAQIRQRSQRYAFADARRTRSSHCSAWRRALVMRATDIVGRMLRSCTLIERHRLHRLRRAHAHEASVQLRLLASNHATISSRCLTNNALAQRHLPSPRNIRDMQLRSFHPRHCSTAVRRLRRSELAEQAHTLHRQIQNLRRTRDLLLPRLLSGQIEVEAA